MDFEKERRGPKWRHQQSRVIITTSHHQVFLGKFLINSGVFTCVTLEKITSENKKH